MIRAMQTFLIKGMGVNPEDISVYIQINQVHKPRMSDVVTFWSKLLKIPSGRFGSPYYIQVKPKKVYENHNLYYGIVRLRVAKSSGLQYKMLAYIDVLREHIRLM